MTARVVLKTANRRTWLKHRRSGLGGTDVASVLGFSRWSTPLDTWLSKTGRDPGDKADSYPMRRGRFMESFILAEYGLQTGSIIEKPPALLAHPTHDWLRASLDGLAHHPDRTAVIDAKSVTWRGREAWWDDERLCPDDLAIQMLTYLAVTGLDEAVLVADVAGELTTVTIARDLNWEARAIPLLAEWWAEFVVADQPPPADWERDSIPALNRSWLTEKGTTTEATDAVSGAVHAYQTLKPKATDLRNLTEALRVQIREGMGTAQTLTIGGVKAANLDARGTLRVTTQKKEHGE